MTVKYTVSEGVALITLDNPPVNGMGYDTRVAMANGLNHPHARR